MALMGKDRGQSVARRGVESALGLFLLEMYVSQFLGYLRMEPFPS